MNIRYASSGLVGYFADHRSNFEDFYPSEKEALRSLSLTSETSILDIGCACGGLGNALHEQFGVVDYTGVEIHDEAARLGHARVSGFGGRVLSGDVLDAAGIFESCGLPCKYDVVVSLSALDWNTEVEKNVCKAWSFVKPGGCLLMSLRLHPEVCLAADSGSVQPTSQGREEDEETAPYVVISTASAVAFARGLKCETVTVYGYWGEPSPTARTSVRSCIFTVAVLRKGHENGGRTQFEIVSPDDLRAAVSLLQENG